MIQSLGRQLLAPFCTPSFNNRLTVAGLHADKKSMGAGAFDGAGLVGSFAHNAIPFLEIICLLATGEEADFPAQRLFFGSARARANEAPSRRRKNDDPRPSIHFSKEVYFNHRGPFLSNYFPVKRQATALSTKPPSRPLRNFPVIAAQQGRPGRHQAKGSILVAI